MQQSHATYSNILLHFQFLHVDTLIHKACSTKSFGRSSFSPFFIFDRYYCPLCLRYVAHNLSLKFDHKFKFKIDAMLTLYWSFLGIQKWILQKWIDWGHLRDICDLCVSCNTDLVLLENSRCDLLPVVFVQMICFFCLNVYQFLAVWTNPLLLILIRVLCTRLQVCVKNAFQTLTSASLHGNVYVLVKWRRLSSLIPLDLALCCMLRAKNLLWITLLPRLQ